MARSTARQFRFGRAQLEARDGETVLAALARRGWPSLARSVRYHRPRGPMCGVGDCTGCLVRVNGVPNVRACQRRVHDGDVVRTENSWPSPRFDLLGLLDLVLPHGVDTVRGLRRPSWAAPLYQRVGRRLAGFGAAPDRSASAGPAPHSSRTVEVVVVGAGRSGRAVAQELVRAGAQPLVVDRHAPGAADATGELEGVERLASTTVAILSPAARGSAERFVLAGADAEGGGLLVRARRVVLATGAYDGALVFEGSDRPGVVTADLALSPLGLPLGGTVVVGGGTRACEVVRRLGTEVEAVVAFGEVAPELARVASELDIPLYPRSRVLRSVGRGHLRALEVGRRDGGGSFRLACRSVVLAHRRLPNAQLAFQAGARRRWLDAPGAYYPEVDEQGRTGVPGLTVVGSAAVPSGAPRAPEARVAAAVLGPESEPGPPAADPSPRPGEIVPYYRELLREPRHGKWVLCPCEDVLLEELETGVARGYRGMELGMRYTGVGTGLCQGRYCLPEAIVLIALLEGRAPSDVGFVTQRPPLVPTALATLAGLRDELAAEGSP